MSGYPRYLHSTHSRVALALLLGLLLVVVIYWFDHHIHLIENTIRRLGPWANFGFIVVFSVLTPAFFSVDILCLIAGALFTLPVAIANVLTGTMIAALIIYMVSDRIGRDRVQPLVDRYSKFRQFEQLIDLGGFRILFLIRLLPLPFALTSYVFALGQTRFMVYWLSTTGVFSYHAIITYFGYLAAHVSRQLSRSSAYSGPDRESLILGVVFCVLIMALVIRTANNRIAAISRDI